ncbi:glycosyltransferase 87 family protein [Allokutzneria sp. A3M-2-11 16]|uniref:glycosyltransferase 87 family protein n=1 Tax=Allokutzneria sp. A3M-2-11 16 TaxID=2962043 RepID=UPI0020B67540|nr:glycosyltransferase 87 family protein [Allokutzneria sp. A3M-2-11 16]MCP3804178.1 glycosyltransferase 87 family protein [Allokutzneria sp. A3M-2-11 16]
MSSVVASSSAQPGDARELRLPAWLRVIAPLVLLAALAAYAVTAAIWPGHLIMIDVQVYAAGGDFVLSGRPLYEKPVLHALEFTYTPFAALVFTPLAFLPLWLLKTLSLLANLALLFGAIWIAFRRLGYHANRNLVFLGVLLTGPLFWLEAVRTTVWLGQINLLLMVILLWDLTNRAGGRWQGVGVGIAAGIKLTPAIFIVYLLLTGRFRAAGVATATFLGTIGLGFLLIPSDALKYWTGTFFTSGRVGPTVWPSNQSARGMIARFFDTNEPPALPWILVAGACGLAGLGLAAWVTKRGNEVLGVTLCGLTGTMVSPFSWCHHWVWFVPLSVYLCVLGLRYRDKLAWGALAAVYLLGFSWFGKALKPGELGPPDTGLFLVEAPAWLEPLTRNAYLVIFVIVIAFVAIRLRREEPGRAPGVGAARS